MRVAVSMRVVAEPATGERRDALSHDWLRWLDRWGVTPVMVPNTPASPADFMRSLEVGGILLSSGNDVAPQPGERWEGSADVSLERDRTERAMLTYAIEQRLPVLGVCRGLQLINVHWGGALSRAVRRHAPSIAHAGAIHAVAIREPRWQAILGAERVMTNSFHRHGVVRGTLAPKLVAWAEAAGGVVEGLAHPTLPILGIQWHPERPQVDPAVSDRLMREWLAWCATAAPKPAACAS